ncbi:hypothetical protein QTG54_002906 [Skeletonema marinoi]|uniref:Uncharacterized protein n=1 Tax=Skeletonema marinoi TaxID=267567 RepID=A0AAD8YIR9_9STRA|nr:hypothetical protein QTG54_002906 [Skeletonema marinoi]
MSSAEEVNSVYENSPIQSKKKHQPVVPKKRMDASVWLKKSQPKARSAKTSGVSSSTIKAYGASTSRSLSSADASFKTKGRGGNNSNNLVGGVHYLLPKTIVPAKASPWPWQFNVRSNNDTK